MDWVTGIFLGGKENLNSFLVRVERYNKIVRCLPCHKYYTALDTAFLFWNNIIAECGVLKIINNDWNPNFQSKVCTTLYDILETKLSFSTAYHPQTHGICQAESMIKGCNNVYKL
ncbi:hypothetical protein O181_053995 [Austropuccinia psidii MF-1]|uniref:Integrase catalytic domain-containing protein n=1 Tax=Austropuccinia psidii MF-1 TaxID=1389203 RepID=A0A9Q3E7X7_9BASI|nr:hypothetical protein [Austropuccinia psidii MF-1]